LTVRTGGPKFARMLETPRAVLELWPSFEAVSEDFKAVGIDVSAWQVSKWAQRGRVPAEFFAALVLCAEARGLVGVTFEALALMHAPSEIAGSLAEART
jgi:hypothetical protein